MKKIKQRSSRQGEKLGNQSVTSRLNRRGKSTTVPLAQELRIVKLLDAVELETIKLTALEQAHYIEATNQRKILLEKIAEAKESTMGLEQQKILKRGENLERERVFQNQDPEAIMRGKRKRLRTILEVFRAVSDSVSKKESSPDETACVTNPLHDVTNAVDIRGSPTKSPEKKKSRSDGAKSDERRTDIRRGLFKDTDTDTMGLEWDEGSFKKSLQEKFNKKAASLREDHGFKGRNVWQDRKEKKDAVARSAILNDRDSLSAPDVTKKKNQHKKQKETTKRSTVDVGISAGGVNVVLDVPVIETKKNPDDDKIGLRQEDKTLLAKLLLRAPKNKREKIRVMVAEQLQPVFRGVSPATLSEMQTNERLGRPQRKDTMGRTRTVSDKSFIEILEKIARLDVDCSLGALNVLIQDARKNTAREQGKGLPVEEIPKTTLRQYQDMIMVNCNGTFKSQWNSQARFEAGDSVRNYFTWACLLYVAIRKGKPELGVSDEEAEKSPVHPMCTVNMDPTMMEFNFCPGTNLSLQLKHSNTTRPHTQQDSGSKGGVSLTQSYKVRTE